MIKRVLSLILLAMLILTGCANNQTSKISTEEENIIKKVSIIYGEQNPKIEKIKTSHEEVTNSPMYFVFLKGNFRKGEQKSQNLEFSMTKDCKKVWALRFDSWVDNEVSISN